MEGYTVVLRSYRYLLAGRGIIRWYLDPYSTLTTTVYNNTVYSVYRSHDRTAGHSAK